MTHTPHDYSGYETFQDYGDAGRELEAARMKFQTLMQGPFSAWQIADDYALAGGDLQDILDAVQARIDGEPQPEIGGMEPPTPMSTTADES